MNPSYRSLFLVTLLLSTATLETYAVAATLSFNGYAAGMPKIAAKAAGVVGCRSGQGITEASDAIYCEIPTSHRKLGNLIASKALLEFKAPQHSSVSQVRLSFEAPIEAVKGAMVGAYGQPTEDEDYFYWERGSETGKLYKGRQGTAYVTFDYDASIGKARTRAAQVEAQKKKTLKGF